MTRARLLPVICQLLLFCVLATPAAAAPPGGTPICRAAGAQSSPAAIADGHGGMFVTWLDLRRGIPDLYAHHLLGSGAVDPAWSVNGGIVTESGSAGGPTIFGDGAGGAHIVWFDAAASAVFAQRIRSDGSRDPAWPANGRMLVQEPLGGPSGRIFQWASDHAGNLYACWNTFDFSTERLWLQRFDVSGAPVWGAPLVIGAAGLGGSRFTFAGLGATTLGPTVVWGTYEDLGIGWSAPAFATFILANGDPGFSTDLVAPFGNPGSVRTFITGLAADPAGGAFVRETVDGAVRLLRLDAAGGIAWPNDRTIAAGGRLLPDDAEGVYGLEGPAVGLDRRAADGSVPAGWTGNGLAITAAATIGTTAVVTIPGGVLLCWSDDVAGRGAGIRAVGVTNAGALAPGWQSGGTLIFPVRGDQTTPVVVATSAGRGMAAWRDLRRVGGDIYGGVVAPGSSAGKPGIRILDGMAGARDDEVVSAGKRNAGDVLSVNVQRSCDGGSRLTMTFPESGDAAVDILDLAGRRVQSHGFSVVRGETRSVTLATRSLANGIYWIRLRQADQAASAKLLQIR